MTENSFGSNHSARLRHKFYDSLARHAHSQTEDAAAGTSQTLAMASASLALASADSISVAIDGLAASGHEEGATASPSDDIEHEVGEDTPLIARSGFLAPPAHVVPNEFYRRLMPSASGTSTTSPKGSHSVITM